MVSTFDRNGLGYTLDREHRRVAGRREVRSERELGHGVDMDKIA